jgi:hypothetical protein
MVTTTITFLLTAFIFYILSFFIKNIFHYYIVVSLLIIVGWFHLADSRNQNMAKGLVKRYPDLFSNEKQEQIFLNSPSIFLTQFQLKTVFIRNDFSAALVYVILISFANAIISGFLQNWISLSISVLIIPYLIFGKIRSAFPGSNEQDNIIKIADRYLKTKKIKMKNVKETELRSLSKSYAAILSKLDKLR